jgi:hypothetical protein
MPIGIRHSSKKIGRRSLIGSALALVSGSQTASRTLELKPLVSVLAFGADSSGIQDSAPSIQKALDSGVESVHVPAGRYRLDGPLILSRSNQTLVGDGLGTIFYSTDPRQCGVIVTAGAKFVNIADFTLLGCGQRAGPRHVGVLVNANEYGETSSVESQVGNVCIQGVKISGVSRSQGWTIGIHSHLSEFTTVCGCIVQSVLGQTSGSGYGILATGANVTVKGNQVLADNLNNGRHGVYLGFGENCIVEDNYVSGFIGSGICTNTSTKNSDSNIKIRRNSVICCSYGTPYNDDSAIGLYMQGGISLAGSGCSISNNVVVAAGGHAIFSNGHSELEIVDNHIREFSQTAAAEHRAISVWSGEAIRIRGNSISNRNHSVSTAIELKRSKSVQVEDNLLYAPTRPFRAAWIAWDSGTSDVAASNNVISATLDLN